jgi:hypothetical protein
MKAKTFWPFFNCRRCGLFFKKGYRNQVICETCKR